MENKQIPIESWVKNETPDLWIAEKILPDHYRCFLSDGGVLCESLIGIENEDEWQRVLELIKQIFGWRFLEVYYVCANHARFLISLKDTYQ